METTRLVLFTTLWTAIWAAPLPKLSRRVELIAGLIPFAAFGLRVFASCFIGVPADDSVRMVVAPLTDWVNGSSGTVPFQWVLDVRGDRTRVAGVDRQHPEALAAGHDLGDAGRGTRLPRARSLKPRPAANGSADRPVSMVSASFGGRRHGLRLDIAVGRREREPSLRIRGRRWLWWR